MNIIPIATVLLGIPVAGTVENPRLARVPQTQTAAALYRRVKPYVVTVRTSDGTGSGFITDEGLLYTSYHVVRASDDLSAVLGNGKTIPLKTVVAADPENDWVCFQTTVKGNIRVAKHNNSPVGARVSVIGSPKGLTHTINEGLMSGRRSVGGQDLIQLSIPSSPGSSGSPVFNSAGEVIGIVAGGPDENTETITYAVPSTKFIGRRGVPAGLVTKDFTASEFGGIVQSIFQNLADENDKQAKKLNISEDIDARRLCYLPTANLVVLGDDEIKDLMELGALTAEAKDILAKECPRFVIVDDAEQDKRLKFWDEEFQTESASDGVYAKLFGVDEYFRRLHAFVYMAPSGAKYEVTVNLTVERGGVSVVDDIIFDAMFVSESIDIADKSEARAAAKKALNVVLGKFAAKWNLANPKPKEEK